MKVGIIGGGWRTNFFLRIIQELPDFECVGVLRTTKEKSLETKKLHKVPAFYDEKSFYDQKPDFVILSVSPSVVFDKLHDFFKMGMPVLVETPPATDIEELKKLWMLAVKYNPVVMVAEQYFCQPFHCANLAQIATGMLGDVYSVYNSMLHGYHGISMIRKYLQIDMDNCIISGRKYTFPITKTCSREGIDYSGELFEIEREKYVLEFANGKVGFWDFSGEQYLSHIRKRHFSIQGTRGEIYDFHHNYLTKDNVSVSLELKRIEMGSYSNLEGMGLRGLMIGDEFLYNNPFEGYRLNDDEIAIATLMRNMKDHLENAKPLLYSLKEALQDTYLAICMSNVKENEKFLTQHQIWSTC